MRLADARCHVRPPRIGPVVQAAMQSRPAVKLDKKRDRIAVPSYLYCNSCFASATSIESPSWFSTSKPDSGMSPEVDWLTVIFLPINARHEVWVVPR